MLSRHVGSNPTFSAWNSAKWQVLYVPFRRFFISIQVRAEVGRCTDLAVPQPRLNLLPRSRSRTAPQYENCTFGKLSGTEAKIQAKPQKITVITVTNSMMRKCYGSIENQRCLFIIPHPPARRMHAEATYDCFSFEPPKGGSFLFCLEKLNHTIVIFKSS